LTLFPVPAHRTGQADFPHPALGKDTHRTNRHVTPSATSDRKLGVSRLIVNPPVRVASCVRLELRSLPSAGITRLPRYYEPLRHPRRPGLSLASCQLILTTDHRWGFPCCPWSPPPACRRHYPGRLDGIDSLSTLSIHIGLPQYHGGSAPALIVSRPAQRLLSLRPARSRNRLAILSIESSDSFVASAAVSIATGWSEPVPGRELHPLKSSAFSRRT